MDRRRNPSRTAIGTRETIGEREWRSGSEATRPGLRSLIVGLGRAGSGLHLPVLSRIRASARAGAFIAGQPFVGHDPGGVTYGTMPDDLILVSSLERAGTLLDPEMTVVHLCTPPSTRADVLEELAVAGFRQIIVEKPLAANVAELERIRFLRSRYRLSLQVMAPWLSSTLTARLADLVRAGELGAVRSVSVAQLKPRFAKSLTTAGHPTAFDVEVPHSLGVALQIAGDARVTSAACTDMGIGDVSIKWMGTARLSLRHERGAVTEILSSLVSPSRERRISVGFEAGRAVGYYPESQADSYAQLEVTRGMSERRDIFTDDALTSFFRRAYRRFGSGNLPDEDFELQARVVKLLSDAKDLAGVTG